TLRDTLADSTATDDEVAEIMDYALGEKSLWRSTPEMGVDRFNELTQNRLSPDEFGGIDGESIGDADWNMQARKGVVAKSLGYDSVGMPDEHGESVLVLQGRYGDADFNPANLDSADLMAGVS